MSWRALLIASVAFGSYVICPRMTAMIVQQAKVENLNVNLVIVIGALISIPLFALLAYILIKFGLEWAIIFAAAGDLLAALLLGVVDLRSGLELAIITVFVYIGIRLAPIITRLILT